MRHKNSSPHCNRSRISEIELLLFCAFWFVFVLLFLVCVLFLVWRCKPLKTRSSARGRGGGGERETGKYAWEWGKDPFCYFFLSFFPLSAVFRDWPSRDSAWFPRVYQAMGDDDGVWRVEGDNAFLIALFPRAPNNVRGQTQKGEEGGVNVDGKETRFGLGGRGIWERESAEKEAGGLRKTPTYIERAIAIRKKKDPAKVEGKGNPAGRGKGNYSRPLLLGFLHETMSYCSGRRHSLTNLLAVAGPNKYTPINQAGLNLTERKKVER